jgi:hypothetical protein
MSAILLQAEKGENIQHTLQDDMESFAHVLGWLSLRYMSHGLSGQKLADMLVDIFDHVVLDAGGRARGGGLKQNALVNGRIPSAIQNKCSPGFHKLLVELTEVLAVRYERQPTAEELFDHRNNAELLRASDPSIMQGVALKLLKDSMTAKYLRKEECIRNSDWMLKLFRDAVSTSDRTLWPLRDGAVKNPVSHLNHHPSERKRKADEELVGQHLPVQKLRSTGDSPESANESQAEEGSEGDSDRSLYRFASCGSESGDF